MHHLGLELRTESVHFRHSNRSEGGTRAAMWRKLPLALRDELYLKQLVQHDASAAGTDDGVTEDEA